MLWSDRSRSQGGSPEARQVQAMLRRAGRLMAVAAVAAMLLVVVFFRTG